MDLRDLACTVLCAVIGGEIGYFLQVGDGAMVIETGDGEQRLALLPYRGEYINETQFLTSDNLGDIARLQVVEETISGVALFTDGIQHLVLDFASWQVPPGFLSPILTGLRSSENPRRFEQQLVDFLKGPRIEARTDDDRTLVIAVRA